ncbi:MAG TPA: hypothetical protein VIK61_09080 [Acidimicrobiia bacterium]
MKAVHGGRRRTWDAELVAETAVRYPKLDLTPWRAALGTDA